jgi:hypothetical protein
MEMKQNRKPTYNFISTENISWNWGELKTKLGNTCSSTRLKMGILQIA